MGQMMKQLLQQSEIKRPESSRTDATAIAAAMKKEYPNIRWFMANCPLGLPYFYVRVPAHSKPHTGLSLPLRIYIELEGVIYGKDEIRKTLIMGDSSVSSALELLRGMKKIPGWVVAIVPLTHKSRSELWGDLDVTTL